MSANIQLSGAVPLLTIAPQSLQTERISSVSFIVPSILAMALMQLGIFAAIPLVQQREKLILKRLNATPLPRWTLVASNVVVRLIIAALQTILILGIGFVVVAVGWFFLHRFQMRSIHGHFRELSTRDEESGRFERAARFLRLYLLVSGEDPDSLARLRASRRTSIIT